MPPTPDNATLASILYTLGPYGSVIEASPSQTLRPDTGGADDDLDLETLGRSDALEVEGTLGTGGMGIVYLATQRALGRKVAVKTLRPEARSPTAQRHLLREGALAASLGHPNVVPVHDLRVDDDGTPHIVMRRIDGERWDQLLDDPARVQEQFHAPDLLAWNLQILTTVCHALQFAHTRGVLHRDVKPENVMIGAHGEVYLMDWGLAVRLDERGRYKLPQRDGRPALAGTPRYMSPEMVGAGDGVVDARTDVYLLGGVLYRLLSGRPPHDGTTLDEIIESVLSSSPDLPASAPRDLAVLCRAALAVDPAHRPPSAAAFREALEDHGRHLASTALADAARARLTPLRAAVDAAAPRRQVYDVFAEVRFGLHHAISSWPENGAARESLRDAVTAVARYELARGEPAAAASVLAELDAPPRELAAEVARAVAEAEARLARLTRIARDQDARIGQRTRLFVAVLFAIVWTAIPLADELLHLNIPSVRGVSVPSVGYLLLVLGIGVWARESMLATALNRRVLATVALVGFVHVVVDAGARLQGLSETVGHVGMLLSGFCISAMGAIGLDHRIAPSAAGYLLAYLGASIYPGGFTVLLALANLMLLANLLWLWWVPRQN